MSRDEGKPFGHYGHHHDRASLDALVEATVRWPTTSRGATRATRIKKVSNKSQHCAPLKAIERFDPDRRIAFSSFAGPTMLGEIKR